MNNTTFSFDNATVVQLVRAAQDGDRQAYGKLFERFEQYVFQLALRKLHNFAEAQELAQDVFVQAMLKIDQLQQPECFGGWLRRIVHRMAINRITRRRPDISLPGEVLESGCVENTTPLGQCLEGERKRRVRAGLKRLRRLDRETLEAFYVNGRSLLEMSDDFRAPLGTIKRRLHVARKRLAKEVEDLVAV